MTALLLKLFVKNYTDTKSAEVRASYGKLSSVVGIIGNVLLCSFKFAVGFLSGSAAVISDAANNLSDVSTCIISLIGFRLAAKPADEEHPFGHGRLEYILSLIISFFVMLMGVELLKNSVSKILHPASLHFSAFSLAVLIAAIALKALLAMFNLSLHKKVPIPALKAVAKDAVSDCLCTGAVLVSLLLFKFFSLNIDGYIGAAVSLLVIYSGIQILKESIQPLIGKPADKETAKNLSAFILAFDSSILGVHDIMIHDYGMGRMYAVAHVEMRGTCTLSQTHEVIDTIEKAVQEQFHMHLVLHADPVEPDNEKVAKLEQQVLLIVRSVDEHYTIHDFRLSPDKKQMHFDLVIDSDIKEDAENIGRLVKNKIIAVLGTAMEPVIHVEFSFTEQ